MRQTLSKLLLSLFLFGVLLYFFDEPPMLERKTFEGVKHTIPYRIVVIGPKGGLPSSLIEKEIEEIFSLIDSVFNRWNPESELSKVNRAPPNQPIPLSENLRALLERAGNLVALTEGRFDPTVFPLHTLWKEHLEKGSPPPKHLRSSIEEIVGWDLIQLDSGKLIKAKEGVAIDLDAFVKGHAVDLLATRIWRLNTYGVLVEWGGEVRGIGRPEKGRPWRVCVHAPNPSDSPIVELSDRSVATSGDAFQSWTTRKGKTYTHVLDPKSKKPLKITSESPFSVTVATKSCADADALATAMMLFEGDQRKAFVKKAALKYPDLEVFEIQR